MTLFLCSISLLFVCSLLISVGEPVPNEFRNSRSVQNCLRTFKQRTAADLVEHELLGLFVGCLCASHRKLCE